MSKTLPRLISARLKAFSLPIKVENARSTIQRADRGWILNKNNIPFNHIYSLFKLGSVHFPSYHVNNEDLLQSIYEEINRDLHHLFFQSNFMMIASGQNTSEPIWSPKISYNTIGKRGSKVPPSSGVAWNISKVRRSRLCS